MSESAFDDPVVVFKRVITEQLGRRLQFASVVTPCFAKCEPRFFPRKITGRLLEFTTQILPFVELTTCQRVCRTTHDFAYLKKDLA